MNGRHRFLFLMIAAMLLAGCGQDESNLREFAAFDGDRWIGNAISYGPHRDGQRPGEAAPSAAEIREDLHLMLPHWNLLRIYSSSEISETLLKVIRQDKLDMKVMLGVWVAPAAPEDNAREVENAIRLTAAYPEIVIAVSVGNETQVYWSAHRSPLEDLIPLVRLVRNGVTVPVTVADDFNFWNKPESLALDAEIDFILVHAHPMWNGVQVEEALPWLKDQLTEVQELHPDRTLVLGETGWATAVHDQGEQAKLIKGAAGEAEQKIFWEQVHAWAESTRQTVFFFEAFDENWKGGEHPNEVEKHWGLFRADRSAKQALIPVR